MVAAIADLLLKMLLAWLCPPSIFFAYPVVYLAVNKVRERSVGFTLGTVWKQWVKTDFCIYRDEGKCVEGILEIFDMLLATTSRFRELKLQHREYLCLKVMILLNSSE